MEIVYIALFAFMILFGFEIRHRLMIEDIRDLKAEIEKLTDEIRRFREELKMKKNAYEEFNPPKSQGTFPGGTP